VPNCKIFVPLNEIELFKKGTDEEIRLDIAKEGGIYSPDYEFPLY